MSIFNRRKQAIIVVSGLPRSGTSLVMQMLAAGGLPMLTDDHRPPDANNPRGYYEYRPVKRLMQRQHDWLAQARGKAVKIVSPLLIHLPDTENYRVIFIRRPLQEVIASQRAMRQRLGNLSDAFDADDQRQQYEKHLLSIRHWLKQQDHIESLYIDHHRLIQDSRMPATQINSFLGGKLDVSAMRGVIDPELYRERG